MIKIENLSKVYGEGENKVIALDNISFEQKEQEKFIAIIGKSGSGKSTLLNIIGALEKATSGNVQLDSVNILALNEKERAVFRSKKIGYIFQAFYLEPEFSVLENVELPLLIAGVNKKDREIKAKEYIIKLGLESKIYEKVKNLSGGQKQRVAIARALVKEPSVLLADEPTGNLDSANGQEVMQILKKIAESGRTVLLVTHNIQDVQIADKIIELQDGKISN